MKNDDTRDESAEPKVSQENAAKEANEDPKQPQRYEFKIAPVDPKNNFDFEDVADK